jgi:predicted transcriptional regulator
MRSLNERLQLAKAVLRELDKQPLGRTALEKKIVRRLDVHATHATFESIFQYLVKSGYVQKSEQRHRASYVITEKGKKLLEGLHS